VKRQKFQIILKTSPNSSFNPSCQIILQNVVYTQLVFLLLFQKGWCNTQALHKARLRRSIDNFCWAIQNFKSLYSFHFILCRPFFLIFILFSTFLCPFSSSVTFIRLPYIIGLKHNAFVMLLIRPWIKHQFCPERYNLYCNKHVIWLTHMPICQHMLRNSQT